MEVFIDERKFSGYDEVADDEQTKKSSKIKPKTKSGKSKSTKSKDKSQKSSKGEKSVKSSHSGYSGLAGEEKVQFEGVHRLNKNRIKEGKK